MAVKSDSLIRDVRYALRTLRRAPAFCFSAIFILAVSIGANTTMFSALKAILLQPLAYQNPDELAVVLHGGRGPVSVANFYDWKEQNRSFAKMGAAEYWTPNLGVTDRTERVLGIRVTSDTLALLGVPPLHGRLIAPDEEVTGNHQRVVIGYGLWQRAFSGDPAAIGKSIRLDGEPYTVIGIMPRDFAFAPFWAVGAELWAPLPLGDRREFRGGNSLRIFARLKPGVSIERAQADITAITARLEQQFPGTNRDVVVMSLKEKVVGNTRVALIVMLVAVGFVLLIACANVAHMLLARAAARQREVAVRLALGATHLQIVRQFLVESVILASLGGLAGLALAAGGVRLLIALAPGDLPRVEQVAIDGQVLAFTLGVSMLTGLIFGLVPAWQSARPAMGDLKSGRGSMGGHRQQARLRDLLIASELALALMLLIGAGLMVRSMAALHRIDPGLDPRGVLSMVVSVKGTPEAEPGRRGAFYAQALDRVRALPGVTAASAINHLPIDGDLWTRSFVTTSKAHLRPEERPEAVYRVILPGYFKAMALPLLRGRDLTESDSEQAAPVVIVNEKLATRQFSGQDPIGQRITLDNPSSATARWMTIVGVAKDAVQGSWDDDRMAEVYIPYLQTSAYLQGAESRNTYLTLVMRTSGDPAALAPSARAAIWSIDGGVAIADVITMEAAVGSALARPRFQFMLLGLFAMVALLLAAAGIYSVMSYAISRRTQEIGLRLTLGAQRGDVLRLVLGQAMIRVAIGASIGLAGALALTRLMANLLYGVQPTDPLTFGVVSLVLIGAALLASYIPARRASRIDPMVALRQE
jgi:putative ABC transport system permease protein